MHIFQASISRPTYRTFDLPTEADARALVECAGEGSVTKFRRYPNNHGGFQDCSCAMDTFEGGKWRSVNIFGG
jgi:hypothetical protein